jgi:RNA polymerase sigma factor (sigma-70 family)
VKPHLLLFATVRKKVADEFRRQNRKPVNLVENSEDIAETAEILWQTHFDGSLINKLDVAKALLDLPQRQRAVLVLRFMDELEISVVAELLGCTPNDVKYAQRTGLDNMRTSQWLAGYTGSAEVHQ